MGAQLRENRHKQSRHKHSRHKQSRHIHLRTNQIHKKTNTMAGALQQTGYSMTAQGVPMGMTSGWQARFEVDDEHVGFIIGKKGGNVKRIRDQTNCQILIQDPDEKSGGKKWFQVRALFKKNLGGALAELAMLGNRAPVKNRGYGVPSQEEYEPAMVKCSYLVVHPDHVGIILGKRGANVTRISREHGAFIYIQEPCMASYGNPWFQIKGLYERNIENSYFALVQEAQRAEQVVPRFRPMMQGPTPVEVHDVGGWGETASTEPTTEDFPPYKRIPRPMPVAPAALVHADRAVSDERIPPNAAKHFVCTSDAGRMQAVIDFVAKHQDGANYPKEDPVGSAFCLSNGISGEDCRKIREAAKAQVEAERNQNLAKLCEDPLAKEYESRGGDFKRWMNA